MEKREEKAEWELFRDFVDPETDLVVRLTRLPGTPERPPLHSMATGRANAGRLSQHVHLLTSRRGPETVHRADYAGILARLMGEACTAALADVAAWRATNRAGRPAE